jgi:hypothetical protein
MMTLDYCDLFSFFSYFLATFAADYIKELTFQQPNIFEQADAEAAKCSKMQTPKN